MALYIHAPASFQLTNEASPRAHVRRLTNRAGVQQTYLRYHVLYVTSLKLKEDRWGLEETNNVVWSGVRTVDQWWSVLSRYKQTQH